MSVCPSVRTITRERIGIFQFGFRLSIAIDLRTFTYDFEQYRLTVTVINRYNFKNFRCSPMANDISFDSSKQVIKRSDVYLELTVTV